MAAHCIAIVGTNEARKVG